MKPLGHLLAIVFVTMISGAAVAADRPWYDRVRLSGSADVGFFGGGDKSVTPDEGFDIWDTRLFVDAELAEDVPLGDLTAVRNIGFTFEWNLIRVGATFNDVGLAYIDLEGIGDSPWLNLRVGRFQIPFGEAYKLYSKGYAKRSFVEQPVGGPWWWDEGLLVHGSATTGRFGYLASVTNGDSDFNDVGGGVQLTLKLWTQPFDWFYASASGLFTTELGDLDGALWLGEGWARPFGSGGPPIPNIVDGAAVADDPEGLGNLWAAGLDVVITPIAGVRIWLAGGHYDIDSRGSAIYDRRLSYWIGEVVLGGELISPALHPFFVGLRGDGVTTADSKRGYLLDVRYTTRLGYNMKTIQAWTGVVGWHLGDYVTLRAEYSHRDIDLVRGASAVLPGHVGTSDIYRVELGLHF
jgi:hypothetical protein